MNAMGRVTLCLGLLATGVAGQAGLEAMSRIDRPPIRRPLASLPTDLGGWVGRDQAIDPKVLQESQATECLSRVYENPKFPGAALSLWVNYSLIGDNMRHSPKICLPSHGWSEVESMNRVLPIPSPGGSATPVSLLAYASDKDKDEIQRVGFWYYINGEGAVERWVRTLPITSRSSHGRTTRGSGLTVEVFWRRGEASEADAEVFADFAQAVLVGLDPILPVDRASYYVP